LNEVALSPAEMIAKIGRHETFAARAGDGSFFLAVHEYRPYVTCAVHHGSRLRAALRDKVARDMLERWRREAPATGDMIRQFPIHLIGLDSRFAYDLDIAAHRHEPDDWKQPSSEKERATSRAKHDAIYAVLEALIAELITSFGACLVIDLQATDVGDGGGPLFSLQTLPARTKKRQGCIDHFRCQLDAMDLNGFDVSAVIEDRPPRAGCLTDHLARRFPKALVIRTLISKVYCNEATGEEMPEVIDDLTKGLKTALVNSAAHFANQATRLKVGRRHHMLRSGVGEAEAAVDRAFFSLASELETLRYINPTNIHAEMKKFMARSRRKPPKFRYPQLTFDPDEVKRELYQLPVEHIQDVNLAALYRDMIENTASKLDLLKTRDSRDFLYHSLLIHGEPEARDIANARYLLHCPDGETLPAEYSDEETVAIMREMVASFGFKAKVELVVNMTSRAMVVNATRTCKIRRGERFTRAEVQALSHHEIGVHMVTNMNARAQKLAFLRLGLPKSTETQEGLAILSELLSGSLTIKRLKELAFRVIAVKSLLSGADFVETFEHLVEDFGLEEERAFLLTTRIYRGGGYTKDFVYLRGLRRVLNHYREGKPLDVLLLGKTSLEYIDILDELVHRQILAPPTYITKSFQNPEQLDPILEFLLDGIA